MQAIAGLLYSLLFLVYVFVALFVVYHIAHYSLNRSVATITLLIFLVVAAVLLFTNAVLFFTLPFDQILPAAQRSFG